MINGNDAALARTKLLSSRQFFAVAATTWSGHEERQPSKASFVELHNGGVVMTKELLAKVDRIIIAMRSQHFESERQI